MVKTARQFAITYQAEMSKRDAHGLHAIKHPNVYVFIGSDEEAALEQIRRFTGRLQAAAFFLYLPDTKSAEKSIRDLKTNIQQNEAGLNLKRVNLFIMADASMHESENMLTLCRRLRALFIEDFSVLHMSLFILLSESNRFDDTKQRAGRSYETLLAVTKAQQDDSVFDRVFVLSDRNEFDAVNESNRITHYQLISHLHYLHFTDSHFESLLQKKSLDAGKPFFITAGIAHLEKPYEALSFVMFKKLLHYVLTAFANKAAAPPLFTDASVLITHLTAFSNLPIPEDKIIQDIQSVASRNITARSLRGTLLREAEESLMGDGCARFFELNYQQKHSITTEQVVDQAFSLWGLTPPESLEIEGAITSLTGQIENKSQMISMRYQSPCKLSLFQNADAVKRMIADIYVMRYKMERLKVMRDALLVIQEGWDRYKKQLTAFRHEIECAKEEIAAAIDTNLHVEASYGTDIDKILTEWEAKLGDLLDALLPSKPDVNLLADNIVHFLTRYIIRHPLVDTSFDEDVKKRSVKATVPYDSDLVPADQFIRQILSQADKKSALAISLHRYDDLIHEKYYIGEGSGMFINYAKQHNDSANTSLYFLEGMTGFGIIRLAGGFTMEDMTRYGIMKACWDEQHGD